MGYSGSNIGDGGIAVSGQPVNPNGIGSGYKLTYHRDQAKWQNQVVGSQAESTAAKIFLGCVPLCFYGLSYLYWRCHEKGGRWNAMTLGGGDLKSYFDSQGFKISELKDGMVNSQVVSDAMKEDEFKDFKDGMDKAASTATERAKNEEKAWKRIYPGILTSQSFSTSAKPTYPEFLKPLSDNGREKSNSIIASAPQSSLSILFYISKLYFNGKQAIQSKTPTVQLRPPSTIREMLYFLAALPFSPNYGALDTHITKYFQSLVNNSGVKEDYELMIPVADSSSPNTNNVLSAADLKDYLTTTCLYCPTILGRFQGNSADSKESGEPWLHRLFSNTQFSLEYPAAGPTLFNALANYAYALQFQLSFLYQQCSNLANTCGWRECRYGQKINVGLREGQIVESHICPVKCTQSRHNTGNHPQNCDHKRCGEKADKRSPLQAFLTDNLRGFCVSQNPDPRSLTHLENHPPGSICHVKMGFQPTDLRRSHAQGNHISLVLKPFCGSYNTPLRQLSEKLSCLTKRTPRTLGDLFGFLWHLNGQLFKARPKMYELAAKLINAIGENSPKLPAFLFNILKNVAKPSSPSGPTPSVLSRSLEAMAPAIPFLYQLFMAKDPNTLPGALFDLTRHCHKLKSGQYSHELADTTSSIPNHNCSVPADLWSLYQALSPTTNKFKDKDLYDACRKVNRGGYLYPLTYTFGSTFAPTHASAYLSWFLHLTDDLETALREMLERFKKLRCTSCDNCGYGVSRLSFLYMPISLGMRRCPSSPLRVRLQLQ
ncbi:variant erythrocyte surface antigen-1 family protein [Babesia caballi]|uniref:Variant erythrocyte surface antigen-1 family protein n=1 Tax=Babesia caballi TaxID=5871 RepID=A0AAV4LMN1_BABCB|nr:variant erythrocyte surface antigen-1 family protein [Babesia caballi]